MGAVAADLGVEGVAAAEAAATIEDLAMLREGR